MSTDDVAQDVSQVTDFHYFTARKFRLFTEKSPESPSFSARNRLVTSSQLGVTFALISPNQLISVPTKTLVQSYKMSKENMNVEVTDLPVKIIDLPGISVVNDMGVNSDGSLLALLHTEQNSHVAVEVFDIKQLCSGSSESNKSLCSTRIGSDPSNQGTCIEWNPAYPDTFAASSSDRTLLVIKINPRNFSNQCLIGIGKFGAITTAISWSPKGKQLTVGDSLGKVTQLKPVLDVVRSTMAPESYGKVTGLCWLATTEWLVSFEKDKEQHAFLMRCKKDKPTEWMQFHELSYSSAKWPLPPVILPATQLLLDWNVVIVGNSKTSEIATVGKREDWQTWVPVEGESIYLPTTHDGKDTVPIGLAIDRSMTELVSLKPDGSEKHRPSPLVLCLTNDGVLTVHHVISTFEPHKPCQITSENIAISGLGQQKAEVKKQEMFSTPMAKPSTIFEQKPAPSAPKLAPEAPKPSILAAPTTQNAPNLAPAPSTPAPAPKTAPKDEKAEQLALKKQALLSRHLALSQVLKCSKEAQMKTSFALSTTKKSISECSEVVKCSLEDSKEVIKELKSLISSIERMAERTQHTVKEMDFEIDEKMELLEGIEEGERIIEKLRNLSETEKLMRFNKLESSADMLNGKFEECAEMIKKMRTALLEKESLRKQAVLSPLRHNSNLNQLSSPATESSLKVMRSVSRIIMDIREKIQRTELDFVHFQRDSHDSKGESSPKRAPMEMSILEENEAPRARELTDSEVLRARKELVARIQKRGGKALKTSSVRVESYRKIAPQSTGKAEIARKSEEMDTSGLSNAILKLSMTPRRVMTTSALFAAQNAQNAPSSNKKDATTQAEEPPVVKTVVVTVDAPSAPKAAPEAPKTPEAPKLAQNAPKLAPKESEPPKSIFGAKAPPTSTVSSSTSPMAPSTSGPAPGATPTSKPSIFGGSLKKEESPAKTVEKMEKTEQKEPEQPKKEPEEPKKEQIPAPEPPKVEEVPVAPEAPKEPKTPVKEEKKEEPVVPKTPSFSFNTTPSTPKSTASSSIFGGGLPKSTQNTPLSTNSSSIFGSKSTPNAPNTSSSSSIFGGGSSTPKSSPFGSFGQSAPAPAPAPVTFSFNTSGSAAPASKPGFGSFGAPSAAPSKSFGAPTVPSIDDGMEDDSMINGGGPSGAGGFMSGLGSSGASSGASNPFAPKPATTTSSNSSWLFGGGAQNQQQQQKPSFSFNTGSPSTTSSQQPSTASSSVFGGGPKFGSQPVFGAKPFGAGAPGAQGGGGLSKNASIFGGAAGGAQGAGAGAGGGFAQFATGQQTSSLFGAGASSPSTSVFGGGAKTTGAGASSSIFGGGASTTNTNKPSTFTSWR